MRSDLFCAFQPKRVTVPSLPFLFTCPVMPNKAFNPVGSELRLRLMTVSVMLSIKPAPKTGVGMRKIILDVLEKLGWLIAHPVGLSGRPVIVKME